MKTVLKINAFKKLKYPEGLILKLKNKAQQIIKRKENVVNNVNACDNMRFVCVPNSKSGHILDQHLGKAGLRIATSSGEKLANSPRRQRRQEPTKKGTM